MVGRGELTDELHPAVDSAGLPPTAILTQVRSATTRNRRRCSTTSTTSPWTGGGCGWDG
ncbi:hypothetical protein [Actinosynnema pretiosum]|uniref:hypothetical protein n=1 Tax=Actinosynnema pretiosum TaxID=42197 RepID=UPI0012FE16E7|nr:hypothetical protein [Actinosynnema pretiosum]